MDSAPRKPKQIIHCKGGIRNQNDVSNKSRSILSIYLCILVSLVTKSLNFTWVI